VGDLGSPVGVLRGRVAEAEPEQAPVGVLGGRLVRAEPSLPQMMVLCTALLPEAYRVRMPKPTRKRPGPGKLSLLSRRTERNQTLFRSGEPRYDAASADEDAPAAGHLSPREAARREPTRSRSPSPDGTGNGPAAARSAGQRKNPRPP
jgi:hypothetical protein